MNFIDTLRGLLRRWYIVFPGLILAAALAMGAWYVFPPGYSRSATQLLIPGESSIPENGNPYLYLGGLAPAADVLVRALGSENVINEVTEDHPGIEIEISRDTTTAGPIILISVTAASDGAAEDVLELLIRRTARLLDQFQEEEDIPAVNRMTVIPVTVDEQSEVEQRSRLLATAGAAIIGTILTLLIAALVEGSSMRRRELRAAAASEPDHRDGAPGPLVDTADDVPSTGPASAQSDESPPDLSDDEPAAAAPRAPIQR